MRPGNKRTSLILLVITTAFLAACRAQSSLGPDSAPGIAVGISSDVCPNIEVHVGQQVTWTNTDSQEHIVRHKSENGDVQFDSGELQPGDSFAFVFVEFGTYLYECSEGGAVEGTITVQP